MAPIVPHVTITRRIRFSSAHRVHNPELSDAENRRLYGKCNNPNYHGHNYTLEVSVVGPIDARTGYVMDLSVIEAITEEFVVSHLDHHNLNLDVDFLRGINPTTENIVVACWQVLAPRLAPARLARLRLWETENNYVEYQGD